MDLAKQNIISRLERDILPLQGLRALATDHKINLGFHSLENAFPNAGFPIGCTHEFITSSTEDIASTNGFIAVLLSKLMQLQGAAVWISATRNLFPAALKAFGVEPDKIIFVDLKKEKDILSAIEEALKCNRLMTVVAEIKQITFKESRRLQLAAEQSRVTGLLIRHKLRVLNTIAAVSRWRITALPSEFANGMPGVGFPRWNVELLKVRNGKPGNWKLEWSSNRFQQVRPNIFSIPQETRKTG